MQMIRLWTSGVFSATRMCSPSAPDMIGGKPSSPMAALASARSRSLNVRVDPGARHHLGAVERPHLGLEEADHLVDRVAGDHPLLDQQRLERLGAGGAQALAVGIVGEAFGHGPLPQAGSR